MSHTGRKEGNSLARPDLNSFADLSLVAGCGKDGNGTR